MQISRRNRRNESKAKYKRIFNNLLSLCFSRWLLCLLLKSEDAISSPSLAISTLIVQFAVTLKRQSFPIFCCVVCSFSLQTNSHLGCCPNYCRFLDFHQKISPCMACKHNLFSADANPSIRILELFSLVQVWSIDQHIMLLHPHHCSMKLSLKLSLVPFDYGCSDCPHWS